MRHKRRRQFIMAEIRSGNDLKAHIDSKNTNTTQLGIYLAD